MPNQDVCALGIYSLKISGEINDIANYGATAIVITSGNDSVQIYVPDGAGWRDTLLGAFAVEIGDKALRFTADNSNAEQPMIDITNTSPTPNVSDTFTLELVGGGALDIGVSAELPVIDLPDQQHATFKLCRLLVSDA